jgi:hypothetical protein
VPVALSLLVQTIAWTEPSRRLLLVEPRTLLSLGGRATPLLSTQTCPLRRPTHAEPGPISGALHNVAEQGAEKVLESLRVQSAWESANRTADQVLVTIVKGGGSRVQINGGPSR